MDLLLRFLEYLAKVLLIRQIGSHNLREVSALNYQQYPPPAVFPPQFSFPLPKRLPYAPRRRTQRLPPTRRGRLEQDVLQIGARQIL